MLSGGKCKQVTATGDVFGSGDDVVEIKGLVVTPGSATTTAVLREGGVDGTVVLDLGSFAASGPAVAYPVAFFIRRPHLTISGAAAAVTVIL